MRLLRQEGFTLIELMVAASMLIGILSATLFAYEQFTSVQGETQHQNDAQNTVRFAMDRVVVDLRNVMSPDPTRQGSIQMATGYDLVFGEVSPSGTSSGANTSNATWVRYCLDSSVPTDEVLWKEVKAWTTSPPPSPPSTAICPDTSWDSKTMVARQITNRIGGQDRPAFYYNASSLTAINSIHMQLFVDSHPGSHPGESTLVTGAFLRNAVQAPAASFTATATGGGGVALNGSASSDPAGQALTYQWYDGTTQVGTGVTYAFTTTPGVHTLTLKVFNSAGVENDAAPQQVNVL
ncbi:MAG: hypothetical protein NVSMB25_06690 [Thermoleophilaceae bacterium]